MGPSPVVDYIVSKVCPHATVLSYDTASLQVNAVVDGRPRTTWLPRRCIHCQAVHVLHQHLVRYGLVADEGVGHCTQQGCIRPLFRGSRFCEEHLTKWRPSVISEDSQAFQDLGRRLRPAIEVTWKANPVMEELLGLFESIRAGETPSSHLRFLDLEFNPTSRRVFEVGMCDANGTVTMDCRTNESPTVRNAYLDPRCANADRIIGDSVAKHNCGHGTMTARQVADELRRQGISPTTMIATWHISRIDLVALREWLALGGFHDVLPPDGNCIPVIPHFRRNLVTVKQGGRLFPLKLSVIFPLLMGTRHHLFGRNHHAAIYAQQLCCMAEIFHMLCKPAQHRPAGWLSHLQTAPDRSGIHQTSLHDFYGPAKDMA